MGVRPRQAAIRGADQCCCGRTAEREGLHVVWWNAEGVVRADVPGHDFDFERYARSDLECNSLGTGRSVLGGLVVRTCDAQDFSIST